MGIEPIGRSPDGSASYRVTGIPGAPYTVTGRYTRKKGLRRTYEYEGRWVDTEQGINWDSKVRCDGQLMGTLGGTVTTGLATPAECITLLVETSIEDLVGISE